MRVWIEIWPRQEVPFYKRDFRKVTFIFTGLPLEKGKDLTLVGLLQPYCWSSKPPTEAGLKGRRDMGVGSGMSSVKQSFDALVSLQH